LRPDRNRVIRETTRVESTHKNSGKKNKHQKKESNVIIRRILKDTKSAKAYIAERISEGSPNREYTIESWDRVGHWRRKPHSEEKIWIEPTECHRHKELTTDKEIHIKL
jgi:hypothetical protein